MDSLYHPHSPSAFTSYFHQQQQQQQPSSTSPTEARRISPLHLSPPSMSFHSPLSDSNFLFPPIPSPLSAVPSHPSPTSHPSPPPILLHPPSPTPILLRPPSPPSVVLPSARSPPPILPIPSPRHRAPLLRAPATTVGHASLAPWGSATPEHRETQPHPADQIPQWPAQSPPPFVEEPQSLGPESRGKRRRVDWEPQPKKPKTGLRYSEEDWKSHKGILEDLYMTQNLSLEKTMEYMSKTHNFHPSQKQYKRKLNKDWGWCKKLSKGRAKWMLHKTNQRKKAGKAKTIFKQGGQEWTIERIQNTLQRAKENETEDILIDAPTPRDVTYGTPRTPRTPQGFPHPSLSFSARPQTDTDASLFQKWASRDQSSKPPSFLLQPAYGTLSEVEDAKREADEKAHDGEFNGAERKYLEALEGFETLLSTTHERANAVAYQLADLYARFGRNLDADAVLNRIISNHVERWGIDHKKTSAHVEAVAAMLTSWDRHTEDVDAFLYRVNDSIDKASRDANLSREAEKPHVPGTDAESEDGASSGDGAQPAAPHTSNGSPPKSNISTSEATIATLTRVIVEYEKDPAIWTLQILQARCALIRLCDSERPSPRFAEALDQAHAAVRRFLASDGRRTRLLLVACFGVAVHIAEREPLSNAAKGIFQQIGNEAEDAFGVDGLETIRMLIGIGEVYQKLGLWNRAQAWFEKALAASMTRFGPDSRLTKSLERWIENKRFQDVDANCEILE